MKNVIVFSALLALMAGCNLTGMNSSRVEKQNTTAGYSNPGEGHYGDPTFEHEVVEPRAASEGAVVSRENTAPPRVQSMGSFEEGMALHRDGKLRAARLALTASLNDNLAAVNEQRALETLREINSRIFLSAGEGGDLQLYVIKGGDSLGKIAQANNTTVEMLQRINGMEGTLIREGRTLKTLNGKFELVVRRSKFCMDLLLDGAFIQRYQVGLGLGGTTPLGEFKVKNRISKPADGSWPFGHAKHRLGTRWLGLHSEAGHQGYGIHGCRSDEESQIPGECSQGCVRMRNTEVEEIYDIVPVGTRLIVVEK